MNVWWIQITEILKTDSAYSTTVINGGVENNPQDAETALSAL